MGIKVRIDMNMLNCACVIHGDKYDWIYVERLYHMVRRYVSCDINFHVFTEVDREVPGYMIKHVLDDWPGISGPRKSWWYKMQVFDPQRIQGRVLYLDLDIIIVNDLDWVRDLSPKYFWAIRDWRYLWRPLYQGINSSVMFWDTERFSDIWRDFQSQDLGEIVQRYHGDQDYVSAVLPMEQRQFFPEEYIKSWRWQIKDGGMDFRSRTYRAPHAGSTLDPMAKIVVFHGQPKPHEVTDPMIDRYWISLCSDQINK